MLKRIYYFRKENDMVDKMDAEAYNNRGYAKHMSGDCKGAIADYDKVISINPKFAYAYYNRGAAKGELGDYKGEIADCDKAIKLNTKYAEAYNNRGIAK